MSRRPPSGSLQDLGPVIRRRRAAPRRRAGRRGPLLILLVLFLVGGVGAGVAAVSLHHGGTNLAEERAPARQVVVFLLDGLPPEVLSKRTMPHVAALVRDGTTYRNAWTGQLENVPLASAATIATGAFPRSDGVVGLEWRDAAGHIQAPTNQQQAVLGGLDQTMQSAGVAPLAAAIKDREPHARILAVGGDNCAETNAAAGWLADYVLCFVQNGRRWAATAVAGHTLPSGVLDSGHFGASVAHGVRALLPGWNPGEETNQVTRYALAAMKRVHPALTVIDLPEYGEAVQQNAASSQPGGERTVLRTIDRSVAAIVTRVRKQPGGNLAAFLITSGQTVVAAQQTISRTAIENAIISAGGEQVYIDGGGTAAIGLQDPLQAQPVAQAIESERLPNADGIYYKIQHRQSWSYQPQFLDPLLTPDFAAAVSRLLATLASASAPDVLVVCAPGTVVRLAQADESSPPASGASVQWEAQHVPLALFGHGVARSVSPYPARTVDVAPTIAALLGVRMERPDGVVLADALAFPSGEAKSGQDSLFAALTRAVRALKQRAGLLT